MSVTDLFFAACKKAIELKGWTVSETAGDGALLGCVHIECTCGSERFAWGFLLPEIAWREAYKKLVGSDWFDVFTECEKKAKAYV